jgi:hypothetical protein
MRVHYSFPTIPEGEPDKIVLVPPEVLELGNRLGLKSEAAMPQTRKQHQVIEHTAKFICKHGHK